MYGKAVSMISQLESGSRSAPSKILAVEPASPSAGSNHEIRQFVLLSITSCDAARARIDPDVDE